MSQKHTLVQRFTDYPTGHLGAVCLIGALKLFVFVYGLWVPLGRCPQAVSICRGSYVICQGLKKYYFVSKEKEQMRVVREDDSGKKDVIYCDHPVDLMATLLKKLGGAASVNQLCQVTNDVDYCQ